MFVTAYSPRRGSNPTIHASHTPPVPAPAPSNLYIALCGRKVRNVTTTGFRPGQPRGCVECSNEITRRDHEDLGGTW
jgi:hypothetical protein